MKFSIIIVTRDAGATIEACLESLAAQTCADFEVVIQDGLSTDDTLPIIEAFRGRHPRLAVRVWREKDAGVYDAMNRALDHARGEWVLFLGGDDRLFAADTLLVLSRELADDDDVVYGDVFSPRFNGRYAGRFSIDRILTGNICHQSILLRRRLFDRLGRFDLRFPLWADWEHNMRWFLSPDVRARYVDTVVAHYADGGLSSRGIDPVFAREKPLFYVRHGRHSVPYPVKRQIVRQELAEAYASRDLPRWFRAIRTWPAVLARVKPVAR
jgi:glycosyltransferase involved in cell wall biosynthesis